MTPHRTTYARVIGTARATSAHPPIKAPTSTEWRAMHHAPRPSLWSRLFARASSIQAHNPTPASIEDDARVKGFSK